MNFFHQAKYAEKLENLSDPDNWIPFESFYELVKGKAITDWEEACGRKILVCSKSDNMMSSQRIITNSNNNVDHQTTSMAPSAISVSLCYIMIHLLLTLSFISWKLYEIFINLCTQMKLLWQHNGDIYLSMLYLKWSLILFFFEFSCSTLQMHRKFSFIFFLTSTSFEMS